MALSSELEVIETYEDQVGSRGVTVYLRLRKLAGDGNELRLSVRKISETVGMTPDGIRKIIRRLAEANMLQITSVAHEDGDKEPNRYTFLV